MARATKVLTLINDEMIIDIPEDAGGFACVQYGTGGTGTIVAEASVIDGAWFSVGMKKTEDDTALVSLAAAGAGWFAVNGYNKIRVRKSVAGPGDVTVGFGFAQTR